MASQHQIGFRTACGLWAMLCLGGTLHALRLGYGGRPFAATLTVFALYFGVMVIFAARNVPEFLLSRFGSRAGYLLAAGIFLGYLIYAIGTNSFSILGNRGATGSGPIAAIIALIFVPLALAASAERKPPGAWQDYVTIAAVWTAVKFAPSHWLWPYPGNRLAYVFTVLLCVNVALATFVLVRRFGRVGYNIGWGSRWPVYIVGSFAAFAAVAIPLGTVIHFVQFAPRWHEWRALSFLTLAILCFTAWPEEFLFRGLLQNMLSRSAKSETVGWVLASILFGFSHITNMGFPNWRYVILASIAGLFYGWTWRKTGSIFASAIVHALVDAIWHFLFRTQ